MIVLLLWVFRQWGMDPLLRYSAVRTLQAMLGARADIGELTTELYPPRLVLRHVALADARGGLRDDAALVSIPRRHKRLDVSGP